MTLPSQGSQVVRFGRRFPARAVWGSVIISAALIVGFGAFAILGNHPEQAPLVLVFLLLPAVVIPASIALNQYAELDTVNWTIRINNGPPRPLADLTHCTVGIFRGVCTLAIGYSEKRSERFVVSSNSPFASPRIERDWTRYLLPLTGLPREPGTQVDPRRVITFARNATLEQAQSFAHELLK